MVGAIEGGTLGALATALGGLVVSRFSPKWKRLGEMTGLIGVGGVTVLALLGMSKNAAAAPAVPAPAPQLPPGTAPKLQTLAPTSQGYWAIRVQDAISAGYDGIIINAHVGDTLQIIWPEPTGFGWTYFDSTARIVQAIGGLSLQNSNSLQGNVLENYSATTPGSATTRTTLMSTGTPTGTPPAQLFVVQVNVSP